MIKYPLCWIFGFSKRGNELKSLQVCANKERLNNIKVINLEGNIKARCKNKVIIWKY